MRCKNCGSRAYPGKYCTGCGMLQPPRVAKGLKRAVAWLSVLVCLLTAIVCYVLIVIEPMRREENAPPAYLSDLRDAANAENAPASAAAEAEKDAGQTEKAADAQPILKANEAQSAAEAAPEEKSALVTQNRSTADVDAQIKEVRADYDAIERRKQRGSLTQITLRKSVYAYAEGDVPQCIVMRSGADDVQFDRSYYFVDGKLRFAYLEADDAVRMYFEDDELLRLRYAENAYNASDSVDYDGTEDEEYKAWRSFAQTEAYAAYDEAVEQLHQREEYICPDSGTKKLTDAELENLTAWELRIARNEIYARHGRRFDDAALQAHFDACSWYEGTIEPSKFSERVLSDVETENIRLIQTYEAALQ